MSKDRMQILHSLFVGQSEQGLCRSAEALGVKSYSLIYKKNYMLKRREVEKLFFVVATTRTSIWIHGVNFRMLQIVLRRYERIAEKK